MPRKYVRKCPDRKVCTEEQFNTAKQLIEEGKSKRKAAAIVGISESSLRKRLKLNSTSTSLGRIQKTFTQAQCPTREATTTREAVEYETVQSTTVNDRVCEYQPTPIERTLSIIKVEQEQEEYEVSSKSSFNKNNEEEEEYEESSKKSSNKNNEEEHGAAKNVGEGNDEYDVFGQLIAHKLRKLTPRNRLLAERRITDIFYDLEQEQMEQSEHTTFPCDPLNTK